MSTYQENKEQLREWLDEIPLWRPGPEACGERVRFADQQDETPVTKGRGSVIFCTVAHSYRLSFTEEYLGATASSRTVRPGEDWTRGSDLPDGKFCRDTFDHIMKAVIGYELVGLTPERKPMADTPVVCSRS